MGFNLKASIKRKSAYNFFQELPTRQAESNLFYLEAPAVHLSPKLPTLNNWRLVKEEQCRRFGAMQLLEDWEGKDGIVALSSRNAANDAFIQDWIEGDDMVVTPNQVKLSILLGAL